MPAFRAQGQLALIGVQREVHAVSAASLASPASYGFCAQPIIATYQVPAEARVVRQAGIRISGAQAQATLAGLWLLVLVGKKFYMR